MIEFNGSYFRRASSKAMSVLVQYDGAELHVWHMNEPFFQLTTSEAFRIQHPKQKQHRLITLPGGARIITEDAKADALFSKRDTQEKWRIKLKLHSPWTIFVLVALTMAFVFIIYH